MWLERNACVIYLTSGAMSAPQPEHEAVHAWDSLVSPLIHSMVLSDAV